VWRQLPRPTTPSRSSTLCRPPIQSCKIAHAFGADASLHAGLILVELARLGVGRIERSLGEGLRLTKIRNLLARHGVEIAYPTLHPFEETLLTLC
jgi:hypothetical protein